MSVVIRVLRELYPALLVLLLVVGWAWESLQGGTVARASREPADSSQLSEARAACPTGGEAATSG